jgi:formylglycine-generating enzyme required for sulfatase activity
LYPANPWGLDDMHGNVWEWCDDCWNDSYEGAPTDGSPWLQGNCSLRAARGGSWVNLPGVLRSACRKGPSLVFRHDDLGFRVSSTLNP